MTILPSFPIVKDEIDSVNHAWNVAEESEEDVDHQVDAAASFQKHRDGWEEDGNDHFDNLCSA